MDFGFTDHSSVNLLGVKVAHNWSANFEFGSVKVNKDSSALWTFVWVDSVNLGWFEVVINDTIISVLLVIQSDLYDSLIDVITSWGGTVNLGRVHDSDWTDTYILPLTESVI